MFGVSDDSGDDGATGFGVTFMVLFFFFCGTIRTSFVPTYSQHADFSSLSDVGVIVSANHDCKKGADMTTGLFCWVSIHASW